ncbi:hypothetical protein NEIPOLOT_02097 [Neisseria polysaccharea ATCC 43768]|nr:hypothetical protein NEIPOLOT_02097 [Neisseria polysaccharea ATCC 43768]
MVCKFCSVRTGIRDVPEGVCFLVLFRCGCCGNKKYRLKVQTALGKTV